MLRAATILLIYVLGFVAVAFGMALTTFHGGIGAMYLAVGIGALLTRRGTQWIRALRPLWPFALVATVFAIVALHYATPDIFTGRDQGSLSTAAILLAEHGTLRVHTPESDAFFSFYGTGKALNFPGFYYTADGALTTQFPLPYIAVLAVFYWIFGIYGLLIANGVLFVLFALSVVLAAMLLAPTSVRMRVGAAALFLVLTQFSYTYLLRHTLSENLAQFLIAAVCALFLIALRVPSLRTIAYAGAVAGGALLTFARIEGIALFIMMLGCAIALPGGLSRVVSARSVVYVALPFLAVITLFGAVFAQTTDFYRSVAVALIGTGGSGGGGLLNDMVARWTAYYSYGIAPVLIVAAVMAFLWFRKKAWTRLFPILMILPLGIYLIDPHISSDAPWMLRRVTFGLLTVGCIIAAQAAARRQTLAIILILGALALPAHIALFPLKEQDGLLSQTQRIADMLAPGELLLVDRESSGDPYALLSGALRTYFHRHSAYIFNPEDLRRVPLDRFDRVYLLAPPEAAARYAADAQLTPRAHLRITTTVIRPPATPRLYDFGTFHRITTDNTIYRVTLTP